MSKHDVNVYYLIYIRFMWYTSWLSKHVKTNSPRLVYKFIALLPQHKSNISPPSRVGNIRQLHSSESVRVCESHWMSLTQNSSAQLDSARLLGKHNLLEIALKTHQKLALRNAIRHQSTSVSTNKLKSNLSSMLAMPLTWRYTSDACSKFGSSMFLIGPTQLDQKHVYCIVCMFVSFIPIHCVGNGAQMVPKWHKSGIASLLHVHQERLDCGLWFPGEDPKIVNMWNCVDIATA